MASCSFSRERARRYWVSAAEPGAGGREGPKSSSEEESSSSAG